MTWPAAFRPNRPTTGRSGAPSPILVIADELFVRVHVDDLPRGVGKGLKVELRNDEVFLLGGKGQLGSHHLIQQHVELIRVVNGFQQHLDRRGEAHELVGDIEL